MFEYLFFNFKLFNQNPDLTKIYELHLDDKLYEKTSNQIKNIKNFKSITKNLSFLSEKLKKQFSPDLKKKIKEFQKNIENPRLEIDYLIQSFEKLPKELKKTDKEKIKFIANMCSDEKYKGNL